MLKTFFFQNFQKEKHFFEMSNTFITVFINL